jgi:hypothetical protein
MRQVDLAGNVRFGPDVVKKSFWEGQQELTRALTAGPNKMRRRQQYERFFNSVPNDYHVDPQHDVFYSTIGYACTGRLYLTTVYQTIQALGPKLVGPNLT